MPLVDFAPERRTVGFPGGSFDVRALCLNDMAGLVTTHTGAIDQIASIMEAQDILDFSDAKAVTEIALRVIGESPLLVANIISSCADEPEAFSQAMALPIVVQFEALRTISEMTFADLDSLKKFVADVKTMLLGILPTEAVTAATEGVGRSKRSGVSERMPVSS